MEKNSPHPRPGSAEKFSSLLPRVRETMRRMIPQGGRAMHEDAVSLLPKTEFTRREFVVTSLAAGFAMAVRPVSAQTITTNTLGLTADEVKIPVESGEIPAYRAMPASGGPFPVVLVVQEIFGVHEHIKDICRRFAKSGHLAVAPELFARQGDVSKMPDINEIISKVVSKVPDAEVMSDLDAVVAWAQKSGKGDTSKLGITGFCWGGRIVWLYAAHNPRLKAGVAWYGRLLGQPSDLQPKNPIDLVASLKARCWVSMAEAIRAFPSRPSKRCGRRATPLAANRKLFSIPTRPMASMLTTARAIAPNRPRTAGNGYKSGSKSTARPES